MPKQKTNSGSKKRFRRTASGFKCKQKGLRHILTKRRTKVKRKLRPQTQVHASDVKSVKRLLGGSIKAFKKRVKRAVNDAKSES